MSKRLVYHGEVGSVGLAHGNIYNLKARLYQSVNPTKRKVYIKTEIKRLEKAVAESIKQIEKQKSTVDPKGSMNPAAVKEALKIIESHELLLKDIDFFDQTSALIRNRRVKAEKALLLQEEVILSFIKVSPEQSIQNKERDIKDIIRRVQQNLQSKFINLSLPTGCVVFVKLVTPQLVFLLKEKGVAAIVTSEVTPPEHVLVLSRALRVPILSSISYVPRGYKQRQALVDCYEGLLVLNPREDEIKLLNRRRIALEETEQKISKLPVRSFCKSGEEVSIGWNVELPEEIDLFSRKGIQGIGLFRTEYLYLKHQGQPGVNEQIAAYRRLAEVFPGEDITIRLFDLGGDKNFHLPENENQSVSDFMGLRAIRYLLEHKVLLSQQLKAIAAAYNEFPNIRLLIPFVSTVEEFYSVKEQLKVYGAEGLKLGIMVETPAAVDIIRSIRNELDFICVGTNDLIQYTLAANRNDRSLQGLLEPVHESFLQSLSRILKASGKVEVTICGEIAAQREYLPVLLGLGFRKFSTSPVNSGLMRLLAKQLDIQLCEQLYQMIGKEIFIKDRLAIIDRFLQENKIKANPDLVLQG